MAFWLTFWLTFGPPNKFNDNSTIQKHFRSTFLTIYTLPSEYKMWCSAIDKKGRQYYYHKLTREVSWHKPTDMLNEFTSPTSRNKNSNRNSPTKSSKFENTNASKQSNSENTPDVQSVRSHLSLLKRKPRIDENLSNNGQRRQQQQQQQQQQHYQRQKKPQQPPQQQQLQQIGPSMGSNEEVAPLFPCDICGRTFNARALSIHKKSCSKLKKKRAVFDMSKQRAVSESNTTASYSSSSSSTSLSNTETQSKKRLPKWKYTKTTHQL